jgi:hypothetical protein
MKVLALAIGLLAAFWAGYGLCAYRAYTVVFPIFQQSRNVSNAAIAVKFVDLIDREDVAGLRAKLMATAKVSTENLVPSPGYSLKAFLHCPLESVNDSVEWTHQSTESQLTTVHADIATCHKAVDHELG